MPTMTSLDMKMPALLSQPLRMLIDGEWVSSQSGARMDVINPSNGQVLVQESLGGAYEVDLAVQAARRAFESGPWSRMRPAERTRLLLKLAEALEHHGDELALLETLNTGKPLKMARAFDIGMAAECLRYNAGWATKLSGETRNVSLPGDWHAYTLREPVGVVGLIVPWNVPLAMAVSKISPALAAGCTVLLKPAELTPLTALRLGELIQAIGFPPGVVNIVTGLGHEAGQAIVDHPGVDKISFTGSTVVGKSLLASAAGNLKRVALELGGKSASVVLDDADLSAAVKGTLSACFLNSGQTCSAHTRMLVPRAKYEEVKALAAQFAAAYVPGDPAQETTRLGPLISAVQRDRVLGYIRKGLEEGAELITGGADTPEGLSTGYFVKPTVLGNVKTTDTVAREEIFGPVLTVICYDNEDEAIRIANDSIYGLGGGVWSGDEARAIRVARRIRTGQVDINGGPFNMQAPFGGYKQSGNGRENGKYGLEEFLEYKALQLKPAQTA
jgi:acyl-CoA reductase-like NAD-dependent aldehyde dehydrogenase